MNYELIDGRYTDFVKNIRKYFKISKGSIHKARNEIKVVESDGEELAVKSFKVPHIINKIVYTLFRDSKAKKSYDNSVKIIEFVPKPIGYIEFKKFGLLDESYFISKRFDYDFTIREPLLDKSFDDREAVFQAFAAFTLSLHERGVLHLDYSPGNILIKKEQSGYTFKLVDINRMEFKALSPDERLKNFAKLWAKDDDLRFIVKEYARLSGEDEQACIREALKYSQAHKDRKNAKKRLRGERVVD